MNLTVIGTGYVGLITGAYLADFDSNINAGHLTFPTDIATEAVGTPPDKGRIALQYVLAATRQLFAPFNRNREHIRIMDVTRGWRRA